VSTVTQPLVAPRSSALTLARDYAELTKLRVTTLIIVTAWCGYYFGALKSGVSSLSWGLLHALLLFWGSAWFRVGPRRSTK